MFTHARRSSSGIIITSMFGSRFRHLQKLHTDAFLGLNAVCLPEVGLPSGAVFRSSLPATPVSTPVYESLQFSEQALRERLCKTPSPRKARLFDPHAVTDGGGLNSIETSWNPPYPPSRGKSKPPCPLSQTATTTPGARDVTSPISCEDKLPGTSALPPKPSNMKKRIYVGNLPLNVRKKQLHEFFNKFGKVSDCVVILDHLRRKSRGFGFVTFAKASDAEKVLQLPAEDLIMDDRQLHITLARDKRKVEAKFLAQENEEESSSSSSEDEPSVKSMGSVTRPEKARNFNHLDDDIVLMIFSYLGLRDRIRIERVCKRWQKLTHKLWQSQDSLSFENVFTFRSGVMTNSILQSILERVSPTALVRLDFSAIGSHTLDHRALSIVANYCPNLEYLNLSPVPATNVALQLLAEKCSKLKEFHLRKCIQVGEKGFWWIFKCCVDLETVDLGGNLRLTGQCFHLAGPNLKSVKLSDCYKLTSSGVGKLANKCKDMTAIYLDNCAQLDDKALEHITQSFHKLKVLHLSGLSRNVSTEAFKSIENLPLLEELNLARSMSVDDSVIEAISEKCARLRWLDVSSCSTGISDATLEALKKCHYLKTLHISYLDKVTDEGLSTLATQGRLEQVQARGCPKLGDAGFTAVVLQCPNLQTLDVSGCGVVTNKLVHACHEAIMNRSSEAKLEVIVGGTFVVEDAVRFDNPNLEVRHYNLCVDSLRPNPMEYLTGFSSDESVSEEEEEKTTEDGAIGGAEWSRTTQMLEDLLTAEDPAALFEQTWIS